VVSNMLLERGFLLETEIQKSLACTKCCVCIVDPREMVMADLSRHLAQAESCETKGLQ
jgi:hypothetical protein